MYLRLQGEEAEAEHHGQAQPDQQLAAVARLQRVMGDGQGHAGGEQDQRVDQRQAPGRDGLEGATDRRRAVGRPTGGIALPEQFVGHHPAAFAAEPRQAQVAGVEQRAEEGAEEHHLGEDEPDHPHPERAIDLMVVVAGLRFAHHVTEPPEQGQHQHRDAEVERPASPAGIVEPAGHAHHGHHHRDGTHERPFALGRDEVHVGVGRCLGHVGIRVRVRRARLPRWRPEPADRTTRRCGRRCRTR